MCQRAEGTVGAASTPIGGMPRAEDLDLSALSLPTADLRELLAVDIAGWQRECTDLQKHFGLFGKHLPARIQAQLDQLKKRLDQSTSRL